MLQITSVVKSKRAWGTKLEGNESVSHIFNVVYAPVTEGTTNTMMLLTSNSFASRQAFKDGFELMDIAPSLMRPVTDSDGTTRKVSCVVKKEDGSINWDATLEEVAKQLVGERNPNAFGFNLSAAEIMGDESVIALVMRGLEMPNIPCVSYGSTEVEAKAAAISRQRARWKSRLEKGVNASVKRVQASAPME